VSVTRILEQVLLTKRQVSLQVGVGTGQALSQVEEFCILQIWVAISGIYSKIAIQIAV
jgi:hypothetical protein